MEKQSESTRRGTILEVPYSEKNEAKALGARWDPDMRKWFVPDGADTTPFEKWNPGAKSKESE